jgi:cell division inhibitor SepF
VTGAVAYDSSDQVGQVLPFRRPMRVDISHPRSFNDARRIGDVLKRGSVVVIVLHEADANLASRIRDFAFGLVAGREGGVAQAGHGILVLTPPGVEMSGMESLRPSS